MTHTLANYPTACAGNGGATKTQTIKKKPPLLVSLIYGHFLLFDVRKPVFSSFFEQVLYMYLLS